MRTRTLGTALILAAGLLVTGPAAQAEPATPTAASAASTFTSLTPVRVLDTRTSGGPVGGGGTVTVDLASRVPTTATAVVLNVTGVTPTAATFVTVFPGGTTRPNASSLNLVPNDTRPNQVTVALGANRTVSLYNNAGNVHLVADLAGHYTTGTGAKYTALPPDRVFDTRKSGAAVGPRRHHGAVPDGVGSRLGDGGDVQPDRHQPDRVDVRHRVTGGRTPAERLECERAHR